MILNAVKIRDANQSGSLVGKPRLRSSRWPALQIDPEGKTLSLHAMSGDERADHVAGGRHPTGKPDSECLQSPASPRAPPTVANIINGDELATRHVDQTWHAQQFARENRQRAVRPSPERLDDLKRRFAMLRQHQPQSPPWRARHAQAVHLRAFEPPLPGHRLLVGGENVDLVVPSQAAEECKQRRDHMHAGAIDAAGNDQRDL